MSTDVVATVVREIGMAMAGLVMGIALFSIVRYSHIDSRGQTGHKVLVMWMIATVGAFALFQGVTRAFLISADAPLDYRDWVALVLQVNSLALLYTTLYQLKRSQHG